MFANALGSMLTETWELGAVPPEEGVAWSQDAVTGWSVHGTDSAGTVPPSWAEMVRVCGGIPPGGGMESTRNARLAGLTVRCAARLSSVAGKDTDWPEASSVTVIGDDQVP